jgi:MarR family 2-MHQ and catechol resistance regulon transcriptional repressor
MKSPSFAPPDYDTPHATALRLWVILNRATESIRTHARADIARHNLSEGEFAILETLYHKGRLTLGDVQRKVLVTSGGTTFLIDKLQKRGLVRRLPCEHDRRSTWAELTPEGTKLVAKIFPAHAEVIRRALSGLGLADQRKVAALLKTLGTEAAALEPVER